MGFVLNRKNDLETDKVWFKHEEPSEDNVFTLLDRLEKVVDQIVERLKGKKTFQEAVK